MLSNFAAVDLQAMPSLARGEARGQGVPCVIATPASLKGFGEIQFATSRAMGRSYIAGWYVDPATAAEDRAVVDTSGIYAHETNYHSDGGQIFCPCDGAAFIALLARPGDDVKPGDLVAFYRDGIFGIHIEPECLAPAGISAVLIRPLR